MEQIGGALLGGLLGGDDSGGSQTSERTPWAPAQDWLKSNITLGQKLQNQYMDNPFSDQQQAAFSNAFGMSDAYRAMLPQLMGGLNQGQFDRRNPLQRPQSFNFAGFNPQMSQMGGYRPTNQVQQARAQIPATPVAAQAAPFYLDFSRSDNSGGGDYGGDFGDGGTWA